MVMKILLFVVLYIFWVMASLFIVFGLFGSIVFGDQPAGVVPLVAIVVYLVMIMIPVLLFNKWGMKPLWVNKVLAEGVQAPATILSVTNTSLRINYRRIARVKLRVEPFGEEPFEAELEDTWFARPPSSGNVQVKYDPNHKKHVVILDSSVVNSGASLDPELQALYDLESRDVQRGGRAAGASMSEEISNLARLHKNGDLSDAEFERAKKKLLG